MARRVSRDRGKESYWRGLIAAQGASGLSVSAFCRREGISPSSFYRWRRILAGLDGAVESRRGESELDPEDVFVPVSVAGRPDKPADSSIELVPLSPRLVPALQSPGLLHHLYWLSLRSALMRYYVSCRTIC